MTKRRSTARLLAAGLAAGCALATASQASAITTTAELRTACAVPGNTVNLPDGAVIGAGAPVALPEAIPTGCTIVVGTDSSLEFIGVGARFAGPLAIRGGVKARVTLDGALIEAPTATIDLSRDITETRIINSTLRSTSGDVFLRNGAYGLLQLVENVPGADAVDAAGAARITTGLKGVVEVNNAGVAGARVAIAMPGTESVLMTERGRLTGRTADVSITSSTAKTSATLMDSTIRAAGDVRVALTGNESSVVGTQLTALSSGGNVVMTVSPSTSYGKVELVESRLEGLRVSAEASLLSQFGAVKLIGTAARAGVVTSGTDAVFRTGSLGTTEVVENIVTADRAIRITTGLSGSCKSELNRFTAPIQQVCR